MKLWGGRFEKATDKKVDDFNSSIRFDQRLYKQDITGSIAHARMLGKQGIISLEDSELIIKTLGEILADIEKGFLGDNYLKIMDRKVAIKTALEMLEDGDVAVICGKGGELYQDINGIKIPYNDFVQVEKFIKSKNAPT